MCHEGLRNQDIKGAGCNAFHKSGSKSLTLHFPSIKDIFGYLNKLPKLFRADLQLSAFSCQRVNKANIVARFNSISPCPQTGHFEEPRDRRSQILHFPQYDRNSSFATAKGPISEFW
jgi:hypothetical protein